MLSQQQRHARYVFRRAALVASLGGACAKCGSKRKPLQFHHTDESTRTWRASHYSQYSRIKLYERDAKAELLELRCRECHPGPKTKIADREIPE